MDRCFEAPQVRLARFSVELAQLVVSLSEALPPNSEPFGRSCNKSRVVSERREQQPGIAVDLEEQAIVATTAFARDCRNQELDDQV